MAERNDPAVSDPQHHNDNLSDDDVALLCDIGGAGPPKLGNVKAMRLERLIAAGFVERVPAQEQGADAPPRYRLTEKASAALTARGAGLNEA
jgi:hypothetical protein